MTLISGFFQVIYTICAQVADWFLGMGTSFFAGVNSWVGGWFTN